MASTTSNFGLIKPELMDTADITAFNENWDKIDEQLKKAGESGGSDLVQTELSEIVGDEPELDPVVQNKVEELTRELIDEGLTPHIEDKQNPHNVTAEQVGALTGGDVVNNLQSDREDLPLSAKMGAKLNQNMTGIKTYVGSDGKLHFTDASGADSVLPFSKGVILTKSVTVGSNNVTSVSFSIASDYADYKNLKINNLIIQMPYDSGNDVLTKCSEVPNMSGFPRIKYTYTASTGKITASVTTNVMFKEVYFYRGFEYVFKVAIIGN